MSEYLFRMGNYCNARIFRHAFLTPITLIVGLSAATGLCQTTIFRDATIIDGNGGAPLHHAILVVDGDHIKEIAKPGYDAPANATIVDLRGKTIMPELINCHGHIGLLKGTKTASQNYTKDNVERHLLQYQDYGVGAVQVMGTDHDEIYEWRAESRSGKLPGATIYSAGRGFGVPEGMPPAAMGMDQVYRPQTVTKRAKM